MHSSSRLLAPTRFVWISALVLGLLFICVDHATAQNSLGIGGTERVIKPSGPFAEILYWIQQQQKTFYKMMTGALKSIRAGHGGGWLLVGLSFLYGVLHAAGPGHGKAVISMYMVANEVQLRRGVLLSFISAFVQATVAIICITALVLVLRTIGYRSGDLTQFLEICSYAAITLIGLWLIWRKVRSFWKKSNGHHHHGHNHDHDHDHDHDHSHHHHDPNHVCDAGCDHAHMPDPTQIGGAFDAKTAIATVLAVGIRPCSGALIVLTFAFLNSLHFYGVASSYAMAVGTGLTVSVIAVIAVYSKQFASKLFSSNTGRSRFIFLVEILGAIFIFAIGLLLLLAALQ